MMKEHKFKYDAEYIGGKECESPDAENDAHPHIMLIFYTFLPWLWSFRDFFILVDFQKLCFVFFKARDGLFLGSI